MMWVHFYCNHSSLIILFKHSPNGNVLLANLVMRAFVSRISM